MTQIGRTRVTMVEMSRTARAQHHQNPTLTAGLKNDNPPRLETPTVWVAVPEGSD